MRRAFSLSSVAALVLLSIALFHGENSTGAQSKSEAMLCHDVFFTLKDKTAESKQKLMAACKKYLSGHEGEVFFAVGVLADERKRDVIDVDFDVALHIVFKDAACEAKYQKAPRHLQFIEENKDAWKKVRVFDSLVQR